MKDKIDRLNKLAELLNSGLITKEEFETLKTEVLSTSEESETDRTQEQNQDSENSTLLHLPLEPAKIKDNNSSGEQPVAEQESPTEQEHQPTHELFAAEEDSVQEQQQAPADSENDSSAGFSIPKWVYLLLLLSIPVAWWLAKDKSGPVEITNSKALETTPGFEIIENTSELNEADFEYTGEIVHKNAWLDKNGRNTVLFSKNAEELFVFHYVLDGDTPVLLRKVQDFQYSCEFDLYLDFIASSIVVSDLDNDDLGEVTFAYKKSCTSDLSPKELKLLLLEDGHKYIIRGTTVLVIDGERLGGKKIVDVSFDNAPDVFLSHTNGLWDKIVEERFGD